MTEREPVHMYRCMFACVCGNAFLRPRAAQPPVLLLPATHLKQVVPLALQPRISLERMC